MKRKLNKRSVALLVCLAVILTAAVGVTLAYIFTNTKPLENTFTPARVSCAVVEEIQYNPNPSDPSQPTSGTVTEDSDQIDFVKNKSNVRIKNTGNTNAYIRVAIVVTWKTEDGTVYAQTPVIASGDTPNDYSMKLDLANGWIYSDGYYYYTSAVAPGELTKTLISSATQNVTGPKDATGRQYFLSIEIVASAIQATLGTGVSDAWDDAKTTGSNQGG